MINSVTGNSDLDSPKQMQILRPSQNSGGSRDPPPPPLFSTKLRPEGRKKIFWETYLWLVVNICDILPSRYLAYANTYDGGLKDRTLDDSVNLS